MSTQLLLKHPLDTPPNAVLDAVHTARRLHGRDALRTTRDMAAWHLTTLVTQGAWHPQATDAFATLARLSRFLGHPVPALPELAAPVLPRLRLELESATLRAQAELLVASLCEDAPQRPPRRAQPAADATRRHLDQLRDAVARVTALLEHQTPLPPLPQEDLPTGS